MSSMCCVLICSPAKASESQRKHIIKRLSQPAKVSESQRRHIVKKYHFSKILVMNSSMCCVFICNAAKASEGQCKDIVKKYYLKKIMRINIFSVLRLHRQAKQSQRKPAQTYSRKIVLKENHTHECLGCVAFSYETQPKPVKASANIL